MSIRHAWDRYRAKLAEHFGWSTNEVDRHISQADPEMIFNAGYNARDKEVRDFAFNMDTDQWIMTPKVTPSGRSDSREVCPVCSGLHCMASDTCRGLGR